MTPARERAAAWLLKCGLISKTDHVFEYTADSLTALLVEAERVGAERMRERAANLCAERAAEYKDMFGDVGIEAAWTGNSIRALPVEGDEKS